MLPDEDPALPGPAFLAGPPALLVDDALPVRLAVFGTPMGLAKSTSSLAGKEEEKQTGQL